MSSVADRFGLWGPPGTPGVAWGNFQRFLAYTTILNPYLPSSLIPALGWFATVAETTLGVALILGYRIRETATVSGILLLAFALGMAFNLGVKAPIDYSVFVASAGALLLGSYGRSPLSIDAIFAKKGITSEASRV